MNDPNGFQIFNTAWTALITVAGAIVAFFTKRLIDQVDAKADKEDMNELKKDIRTFLDQQRQQHQSNTERLDNLIMVLGSRQNSPYHGPDRRGR